MSLLLAFILAAMAYLQPGAKHDRLAHETVKAIEAVPALFPDDTSKLQTAALVVAVMFRESSFRHGLVSKTGDFCEMQLHGRADTLDDRALCLREGIRMLRASIQACPSAPLAVYAGGGCHNARARKISDDRIGLAGRILANVGGLR
jgi:hypothetical protein